MQEQKSQNELSPRVQKKSLFQGLLFALKNARFFLQARLEGPQAERAVERLNTELRNAGVSEESIKFLKTYFLAWRKGRKDDVAFHTLDRYLVGGAGILDLILLQILVPIGVPDLPSSLAWIAFTISLPCAVGSLFSSFLKKERNILTYGRVHGTLSGISQFAALVSATALIWHIWFIAGLVFLCVSIVTCIICFLYVTLVILGKHFMMAEEGTEPIKTSDELVTPVPAEAKPTDVEDQAR